MDLQLDGKKALVTASTGGIGRTIARQLAEEGAQVIINGRSQDDVDAIADHMRSETGNDAVSGVAADFSNREDVEALIRTVDSVDILVNNVGIYNMIDFGDITDDEWMEIFEVNVLSGVRLARHYFPKMKDQDWGRIIFISSESALNIPTEMIHYGMSKTAQLSISRGLARLSKGTGVTVNAVLPGPTRSRSLNEMMEQKAQETGKPQQQLEKEFIQENRPTSLIQRFATTQEVANLVAYTASPRASATNGAALRVDGGVVNNIT